MEYEKSNDISIDTIIYGTKRFVIIEKTSVEITLKRNKVLITKVMEFAQKIITDKKIAL